MRLFSCLSLMCLCSLAQAGEARLASLFAADSHAATAVSQAQACAASRDHWFNHHGRAMSTVQGTPVCECHAIRALDLSQCAGNSTDCQLPLTPGYACTFLGPVDTVSLSAPAPD